jgi:hypothetical protein
VIGTDRRIIVAISSELNMNTHADKALAALAQISHREIDVKCGTLDS